MLKPAVNYGFRLSSVLRSHVAIRTSTSTSENRLRLVHVEKQFEGVPPTHRNKETFLAAVAAFKERGNRGHVEFINSALKYVKEFGIHKDLDTYKALLNVFPKGKLIPQNTFQRLFLHYPMQQNCCVKVLDEMEWHGVQPDKEIHDIVVNAFGEWNFATKKIKRMLYWMPKLKHSNKYLDRRLVEGKSLSRAQLSAIAVKMMARDPSTSIKFIKVSNDSAEVAEDHWIVSGFSHNQLQLINSLPSGSTVFVDGPFPVFLMENQLSYVMLSCAPTGKHLEEFECEENADNFAGWFEEWESRRRGPRASIHEQKHESILALAALHSDDNRTAAVWINHLQESCPKLRELNIRYRLENREENAQEHEKTAAS